MADNHKYVECPDLSLFTGVSAGSTSITINNFVDIFGNALSMSDFGTKGYGRLNPDGKNISETFTFTGVTSNTDGTYTLTGVSTVDAKAPYTETSGLVRPHSSGSVVRVSNTASFYNNFVNKNNDETITQTHTFTTPNVPRLDTAHTYTAGHEEYLATKRYADSLAIAGAPDASTTQKGVVEEATDAELQAGTATGGTGARLFASGASHSETSTANKVPVAKSSGAIDDGYISLTTAGDIVYSDGTDLQRLGATDARYLRMNGTTPEWSGSNLDEADTFFGSTDMSGAEAETLTDGSDADTLHTHSDFEFHDGVGSHDRNKTYSHFEVHLLSSFFTLGTYTAGSFYCNTFQANIATSGTAITTDSIAYGYDSLDFRFNTTRKVIIEFVARFNGTGNDAAIGLTTSTSSLTDYDNDTTPAATFSVDSSGNLYAHTSDGAGLGNNTETAISGVTISNNNTYRIEFDPGVDVKFYVNGTLEHTATTGLPSGANTMKFGFGQAGGGCDIAFVTAPKLAIEK